MDKLILAGIFVVLVAFFFYQSHVRKQAAAENLKKAEVFLAENKLKEEVVETKSGLQYRILKKGDGSEQPKKTDRVRVHYHGKLLNGDVFDSSVDRGEPLSFKLNQVISGWTEGLQLMSVGDKFEFYIPSNLAYGNSGSGQISGGALLIFEVELLGINP